MKAKIEVVKGWSMKAKVETAVDGLPVTYGVMLGMSGTYRIKGYDDVFVVSFGDDKTALYVSDGEVAALSTTAWTTEDFVPLASPIIITFPGASQ